jgi:hypothetical protein
MSDINHIASKFLLSLKEGSAYSDEPLVHEVEPLAAQGLVALKRTEHPQYFYGFKPSGRPVFVHDLRLARSFEVNGSDVWHCVSRLQDIGVRVSPASTVWKDGVHQYQYR